MRLSSRRAKTETACCCSSNCRTCSAATAACNRLTAANEQKQLRCVVCVVMRGAGATS